jgi:hypothetical protein
VLGLFVQVVLGTTFALSAALKLMTRRDSVGNLKTFGVPARLCPAVYVTLIALEVLIFLTMLIGGSALVPGLALAAVLLVGFSGAILRVLVKSSQAVCNCFGHSSVPISAAHLCRNGGLLVLSMAALWQAIGITAHVDAPQTTVAVLGSQPAYLLIVILAIPTAIVWAYLPEIAQLLRSGNHSGSMGLL